MSPLGRQRPTPPTEEEQRAAEVDLERIRDGGIPLGAEERLKRVAAASTPFFTSDLSVKEYALAQASGLQPVAQVMGSSVVQHGWTGTQGGYYSGYARFGEVQGLSEPWNLARRRAFHRLQLEADYAGADAVIGIELSTDSMGAAENLEYLVFGTAVRDTVFARQDRAQIAMCALSGQEVDKLRRIGARTCGVVGHTTVVSVQLSPGYNYVLNSSGWAGGAGRQNMEITEISQAVYEARRIVMSEIHRQAAGVGANSIVVSNLQHSIGHREYEQAGGRINIFLVMMHVLGTAVRLDAHQPHPSPLGDPVMSISLSD